MLASEVISELQKLIDKHGDLPVSIDDYNNFPIICDIQSIELEPYSHGKYILIYIDGERLVTFLQGNERERIKESL